MRTCRSLNRYRQKRRLGPILFALRETLLHTWKPTKEFDLAVAEGNADRPRRLDQIAVGGDFLDAGRHLVEGDLAHVDALEAYEDVPVACNRRVGRRDPKARREHPVKKRRRAAPLNVPKYGHSGLDARVPLDQIADHLADPSKADRFVASFDPLAHHL